MLIYDQRLRQNKVGSKIIASFPWRYSVPAGEKLKDLKAFPFHVEKIVKILRKFSEKKITVVALGGGSVGDFAGFFASAYRRGQPLVQIPSTWLAAIDSSHGGKTALNAAGAKNQIGSFYSAEKVLIFRDLLLTQPQARWQEAQGELFKMAIIEGGGLWKNFSKSSEEVWPLLPSAVKAKYKVVQRDPFEKKGHRQLLNLGHTLGHVIEVAQGVPHGQAVGQGLIFALRWSLHQKYLSRHTFRKIEAAPLYREFEKQLQLSLINFSLKRWQELLSADKKKEQARSLNFIFVSRPGRCFRKKVEIKDILQECQRQKDDREI